MKLIPYLTFLILILSCSSDDIAPPVACFTIGEHNGYVGEEIQFNNCSDNFTLVKWDFGDGVGSNLESPIHVFNESGQFTVAMVVENEGGMMEVEQDINIRKVVLDSAILENVEYIGREGDACGVSNNLSIRFLNSDFSKIHESKVSSVELSEIPYNFKFSEEVVFSNDIWIFEYCILGVCESGNQIAACIRIDIQPYLDLDENMEMIFNNRDPSFSNTGDSIVSTYKIKLIDIF